MKGGGVFRVAAVPGRPARQARRHSPHAMDDTVAAMDLQGLGLGQAAALMQAIDVLRDDPLQLARLMQAQQRRVPLIRLRAALKAFQVSDL